jgi:hypothetical protein
MVENLHRGILFLWHLKWWTYLYDHSKYNGAIGDNINSFPSYYIPDLALSDPVTGEVFSQIDLVNELAGKIDLSNISIAGHSRAGEAAVYTYLINHSHLIDNPINPLTHYVNPALEEPFSIKSITGIAPSFMGPFDTHASILPFFESLDGCKFFVIAAASDCDIKCCGPMHLYNQIPDQFTKSMVYIYGANHSWFNSIWAEDDEFPDGDDCGSYSQRLYALSKEEQIQVSSAYISAFVRETFYNTNSYKELFWGRLSFPSTEVAPIFPIHHDGAHIMVDSGSGYPWFASSSVTTYPLQYDGLIDTPGEFELLYNCGLDSAVRRVRWDLDSASNVPYIEYRGPWNLSGLGVLSFRSAWTDFFDWEQSANPIALQWLSAELISGSDVSTVHVSRFGGIPRPYPHPQQPNNDPYNVLTTIRIPLEAFRNNSTFDLSSVDKLRIYFNRPHHGEVYLDDVVFSQ